MACMDVRQVAHCTYAKWRSCTILRPLYKWKICLVLNRSGSNCHDPSFEADVDLEEKEDNNKREDTYKTRNQEFLLPETKITRLLKGRAT